MKLSTTLRLVFPERRGNNKTTSDSSPRSLLRRHASPLPHPPCTRWSAESERGLTGELQPDEVLEAQVFQEDPRRSAALEVEGDVGGQLGLQGGEVEVGGLLVERRRVPHGPCKGRGRRGASQSGKTGKTGESG